MPQRPSRQRLSSNAGAANVQFRLGHEIPVAMPTFRYRYMFGGHADEKRQSRSSVGQHPEDPQIWNPCGYRRNNSPVSVDPSNEHICGTGVTQSMRENFQKILDHFKMGRMHARPNTGTPVRGKAVCQSVRPWIFPTRSMTA
jgi:hypothetical protein